MRKLSFILVGLIAFVAQAYDFEAGGIYYKILSTSDKTCAVTSSSYDNDRILYAGNISIPETVKYNGNTYTVKSIDSWAFHSCVDVLSISLPKSIVDIDVNPYPFQRCSSLKQITVDAANNNYTSEDGVLFNRDKTLLIAYPTAKTGSSYSIPNTVTRIREYAFYQCANLSSINITEGVKAIEGYAFYQCPVLKYVYFNAIDCESSLFGLLGEGLFMGCNFDELHIGSNVKSIPDEMFRDCTIEGVYINDLSAWCDFDFESSWSNPLRISNKLYLNNVLITDLVLPNNITEIKDNAFYGANFSTVILPKNLISIGENAFKGSQLQNLIIPPDVTTIGSEAFGDATIISLTIPEKVTDIGGRAFGSSVEELHFNAVNCESSCNFYKVNNLIFGNNVETIPDNFLYGNDGLTEIEIPISAKRIGCQAFALVKGIKKLIIPSNVEYIDTYFIRDSDIEELIIEANITSINANQFYCSIDRKIKSLTLSEPITTIESGTFQGQSSLEEIKGTDTNPCV